MWACMGYIVPEYFRWPGYCSPSSGMHCAHYGANMLHATLDGEDPVLLKQVCLSASICAFLFVKGFEQCRLRSTSRMFSSKGLVSDSVSVLSMGKCSFLTFTMPGKQLSSDPKVIQ